MPRDPQLLLTIQVALIGIVVVVGFFFIWRTLSRLEARIDELSSRDCRNINNSCQMVTGALSGGYNTSPTEKTNNGKVIQASEKVNYKKDMEKEEEESDDYDEEEYEEEDEDDIALMKACFGGMPLQTFLGDAGCPFTIFKSSIEQEYDSDSDDSISEKTKTKIILEEARDDSDESNESEKSSVKSQENDKKQKVSVKSKEEATVSEADTQEFSKTKLKKMNLDALRETCSSRGLPTDGSKATLMDRILSSIPTSA